jgi:hypothetical protein
MPHEELKSDLISAETILEMKFSKENFRRIQEMSVVQMEQIRTIEQNLKDYQETTRQLKNEVLKRDSSMGYLQNIVLLKGKKINILKNKIKYLKFKRTIEITINNKKNAE